jgi:hypothetical protein
MRGKKLPDDIIELIYVANEFNFSMSLTERILKIDRTTVRKYLDKAGLPHIVESGGLPISKDEEAKIYQYHSEGYTTKEIADKIERPGRLVYKYLAKANLRPIKRKPSFESKRPEIEAAYRQGMTAAEVAKELHVSFYAARGVRNDLGLETRVYVPHTSYRSLKKVYDAYCTDTPPYAVKGVSLIRDTVAKYYRGLRKLDAAPAGKPLTLEDITKSQNKGAKSVCRAWLHFFALQGNWTILSKNKFQKIVK